MRDVSFSSSGPIEKLGMVGVAWLSSSSNNLFSSLGSSILGGSTLGSSACGVAYKETSLGLVIFFLDGDILRCKPVKISS